MPKVTFVLPDGKAHQATADTGLSLLEIARLEDIDIEGTCGGSMACATCHVWVREPFLAQLPAASPEEEDMLDFAEELQDNSRLGCQLRLTPELDGLTVDVPPSTLL